MVYTDEQKQIAKKYEELAFQHLGDDEKFKQVMDEFEAIEKSWGAK